MPGLNRVGVSRKIAGRGPSRRKLREIMNDLNPPKGLGFIVWTAGLDRIDAATSPATSSPTCSGSGR